MSRITGVVAIVVVVLVAMAFAASNAGHVVNLDLGLVTFYRVPVTLVAFAGLFTGMVVMFATGIHSDLKVRRILRERLADEAQKEQRWIDRDQRDLFSGESGEPSARDQMLRSKVEPVAPPVPDLAQASQTRAEDGLPPAADRAASATSDLARFSHPSPLEASAENGSPGLDEPHREADGASAPHDTHPNPDLNSEGR